MKRVTAGVTRRAVLRHALLAGFAPNTLCVIVSAAQVAQRPERVTRTTRIYLHVAASDDTLGVLFARDLARHQAQLERLRKKHRYYLTLRFRSTNRYQLPYALDVVEYFFRDPDLVFVASVPTGRIERTGSDLTDSQLQQRRLLELVRVGLGLRSDAAAVGRRLSLDVRSPGKSQRGEIKRHLMQSIGGLSYIPAGITKEFPPQRLPENMTRKRVRARGTSRIREAPNNIGEVASFLTGCARALRRAPASGIKQTVRQALRDRLGVTGNELAPVEKSTKFRLVL